MKYVLLNLILISSIAGCNSSLDKRGSIPVLLNADNNKDSSNYLLKRIFGDFPRGGRFGGHPGIAQDGKINFPLLFSDTAIIKADGAVKISYTYFNGTDSVTEIKEIHFGLPSSN
ncbi:hypothetical protein [Chitinophaga niabensis]|uniref:Uncharacterized protein n=1 Tax=Chitinophaga niabensis TaxID=536979 RepID=A0A1N6E325_9BACT|nr:hypothetical protein [Chitinophaga niabensis]SIN77416.1 hypothetical protein SAMN04488055_1266 [Chitinophaga niabensis]